MTRRTRAPKRRRTTSTTKKTRTEFVSRPPLPLNGFPASTMARLRFVTEKSLDASVSDPIAWINFRANSAYDPDEQLGGHQPTGFDEFMNIYNHCTVVGSKIKVTPYQLANGAIAYLGIGLFADSTDAGTYNSVPKLLASSQFAGTKLLTGVNGQAPKPISITKSFSAKKFFGTKNIVGKGFYRHSATANPSEQAFFTVAQGSASASNAGVVHLLIEIDYICVFSERKPRQDF